MQGGADARAFSCMVYLTVKGEAVVGRQQLALSIKTRESNHIMSSNLIFYSPPVCMWYNPSLNRDADLVTLCLFISSTSV